jgi:hypothetical protein
MQSSNPNEIALRLISFATFECKLVLILIAVGWGLAGCSERELAAAQHDTKPVSTNDTGFAGAIRPISAEGATLDDARTLSDDGRESSQLFYRQLQHTSVETTIGILLRGQQPGGVGTNCSRGSTADVRDSSALTIALRTLVPARCLVDQDSTEAALFPDR